MLSYGAISFSAINRMSFVNFFEFCLFVNLGVNLIQVPFV